MSGIAHKLMSSGGGGGGNYAKFLWTGSLYPTQSVSNWTGSWGFGAITLMDTASNKFFVSAPHEGGGSFDQWTGMTMVPDADGMPSFKTVVRSDTVVDNNQETTTFDVTHNRMCRWKFLAPTPTNHSWEYASQQLPQNPYLLSYGNRGGSSNFNYWAELKFEDDEDGFATDLHYNISAWFTNDVYQWNSNSYISGTSVSYGNESTHYHKSPNGKYTFYFRPGIVSSWASTSGDYKLSNFELYQGEELQYTKFGMRATHSIGGFNGGDTSITYVSNDGYVIVQGSKVAMCIDPAGDIVWAKRDGTWANYASNLLLDDEENETLYLTNTYQYVIKLTDWKTSDVDASYRSYITSYSTGYKNTSYTPIAVVGTLYKMDPDGIHCWQNNQSYNYFLKFNIRTGAVVGSYMLQSNDNAASYSYYTISDWRLYRDALIVVGCIKNNESSGSDMTVPWCLFAATDGSSAFSDKEIRVEKKNTSDWTLITGIIDTDLVWQTSSAGAVPEKVDVSWSNLSVRSNSYNTSYLTWLDFDQDEADRFIQHDDVFTSTITYNQIIQLATDTRNRVSL
jgi:hypothetical protein